MNNHLYRALHVLIKRKKERSSEETKYRKDFYIHIYADTHIYIHAYTPASTA